MCVSQERDVHKLLKTLYYWQPAHPNGGLYRSNKSKKKNKCDCETLFELLLQAAGVQINVYKY